MGVSKSYVFWLVLLRLGVRDSYVWGLAVFTFRGYKFLRFGVSCPMFRVTDSYFRGLVFLRLEVRYSYVWRLVFLRLGVSNSHV